MTAEKNRQYERAQQELEQGRDLISKRQKVFKLADKASSVGVLLNLMDKLALDDEDAKKIKKQSDMLPRNPKNGWLYEIKGKQQSLPIKFILIVTISILFVHLPGYRSISSGITTQITEPATTSAVVVTNQDIGQAL